MKCKFLFTATLIVLGIGASTLYSQSIDVVSTGTAIGTLSTTVADFTLTAQSCAPGSACTPTDTCNGTLCNTAFFILYGDGHYDLGTGTSIPKTHKYPLAGTPYTAKAWFAKKKDVDPPSLITKNVLTGTGGTYTNPLKAMSGNNVKIGTSWLPVAGDPHFVILTIANTCGSWPSGTLEFFYHDAQLEVNGSDYGSYNNSGSLNCSPLPSGPGTANYNQKCVLSYTGLTPGIQKHFFIPVTVKLIAPSTPINYKAVMVPGNMPCNKNWLNVCELKQTTALSAHDPNSKTVNIESICSNSPSTVLEYRIRFQNDGEYFADPIVVTDVLDPNLVDPLSVEVTSSSHGSCLPCIYSYDPANPNIAIFTFMGIQLPGSNQIVPNKYTYDETLVEFTFTVNTHANLPPGVIPNVADVVFYPGGSSLQTNFANVLINESTDDNPDCVIRERDQLHLKKTPEPAQIIAVPNPFFSILKLIPQHLPSDETTVVEILDLSGQYMARQTFLDASEWVLHTTNWPAGLYIVRIQTEHNVTIQRVVKQ